MVKRVAKNLDGQGVPAAHRYFPPREPWKGRTEYGSKMSKEILSKLTDFSRRKPSRDWAKRVLDRHAAGESFPMMAIEMALEIAPKRIERQPGEDDV